MYHYAPFPADAALVGRGYLAVPFFFVLSGFVLAYSSSGRGVRAFWIGRLTRLYPTYLLGLGLAAALAAATGSAVLLGSALSEAGLIQAWAPGSGLWLNGPGWSLSVEMALYASFPLLLPLVRRASRRGLLVVSALAWLLASGIALLGLVWLEAGGAVSAQTLLFWPPFHLGSFLLGMSAGTLVARSGAPRHGSALAVFAMLVLVGLLGTPVPGALFHDGLLSPVFLLMIVGLARGGPFSRVLGSRALVALGNASYALYILQAPLWGWWLALGGNDRFGFWPWLGLLVICSLATHRWFERPSRAWLQQVADADR
jgi:peptidoglycan/LPS O-acetylase OafA/YrhL